MPNILSLSTNPDILPVMDRLVINHADDWQSFTAPDLDTARQVLAERDIDVVLLGAGTGEAEHAELQTVAVAADKATKFVYHYGGGSGLLYAEVEQALG